MADHSRTVWCGWCLDFVLATGWERHLERHVKDGRRQELKRKRRRSTPRCDASGEVYRE